MTLIGQSSGASLVLQDGVAYVKQESGALVSATPGECAGEIKRLSDNSDILADALVQARRRVRGPVGAMKALGRDTAIARINDALEQAGYADMVSP